MIIYIASPAYNDLILESANEAKQNIMNQIVGDRISLSLYIKQQLEYLQAVKILIIDLTCLSETEEEIIQALNSLRLFGTIRIIVLAPDRTVGDSLLAEIFSLGIYDIISFSYEEDNYYIKEELSKTIKEGKEYKDSVKFKERVNIRADQKQIIREKIIIKNEIRQSVNKALIGIIGTQSRIGVTHNSIVIANYLKNKGYHIALVENSLNENKCFHMIQELFYDLENVTDECFSLNHVDYYKNYDIQELHKIISKNYNFIIIDFGEYKEEYLAELRRCVIQIIITGSKSWELEFINKVFKSATEEELRNYTYLFNFTDLQYRKDIKENMSISDKVFFTGYTPDPFNSNYFPDLDKIFKDYLSETKEKVIRPSLIKGLINKINDFVKN